MASERQIAANRKNAQKSADQKGEENRQHTRQQRQAAAIDHSRSQIAADLVGSEPMA